MKKIILCLVVFLVGFSGCQENESVESPASETATKSEIEVISGISNAFEDSFTYNTETYNYEGAKSLTGYASVVQVEEAWCEENCATYDYVFFNFGEEDKSHETFARFLSDNEGNAFVKENAVGLGCLDEGVLYSATWDSRSVTHQLIADKIMASNEDNPITIYLRRVVPETESDAPTCYAHFLALGAN